MYTHLSNGKLPFLMSRSLTGKPSEIWAWIGSISKNPESIDSGNCQCYSNHLIFAQLLTTREAELQMHQRVALAQALQRFQRHQASETQIQAQHLSHQ